MENKELNIDRLIENAGITTLNEMQQAAIALFPNSQNIVLAAPTGSGKTLAFLLMLLKVLPENHIGTFCITVTPTRELAMQITSVFQSLKTGFKITACYGGHKREIEENNLREAPAIIVGTPGRLGDHLRRNNINPATVQMIILDEFDKSMEMGFEEEMRFLFSSMNSLQYKMFVSATPSLEFPAFVPFENPEILDFSGEKKPSLGLHKIVVDDDSKQRILLQLLCTIGNRKTIVFVNQKETLSSLSAYLKENGIDTLSYHGSLEQKDREVAISKFRNGSNPFLLTTDLASRGLDVTNVRFIIHYDFPGTEQIFIHRNGRSARMDASGEAILFSQTDMLPDYVGADIPDFRVDEHAPLPGKPDWGTLYFSAGKKDKINKMDIAGFLMQKAGLKREDTGLIEVKDFYSFAAVRRSKMSYIIGMGREQRIKNKKVKIAAAR